MAPDVWTWAALAAADLGRVRVWASPSVEARVRARAAGLPWTFGAPREELDGADTLIAVGGGALLDEAKLACRGARRVRLVAIASLWGSGAEASPIAVVERDGRKVARMDDELLPDVVATWPELAETVTPRRARQACADAWAHLVEGMLSPLATADLRAEAAPLVRAMLGLPLAYDPRWFTLSALACQLQAASSVGLVHGIAHVLETAPEMPAAPIRSEAEAPRAGHAALCAAFLAPVLALDRAGPRWRATFDALGVSERAILDVAARVHEPELYAASLPALEARWRDVLREPCTRTNSTLVRPDALAHFRAWRAPDPSS